MGNFSRVQSIDRAIAIFKCFNENDTELKLSEISDKLGLNKSTVHGILNTLKYHGLICQCEYNQKYRLGTYLIKLGDLAAESIDIRNIAHPRMKKICEKFGETVHIGMLEGTDIVYIDKVECHQSIKISTSVGTRYPAYCTADGRAMLSSFDRNTLLKIIPDNLVKYTDNTVTDKKKVIEKIIKIRDIGYETDDQEYVEGLVCVAAPIYDYSGKAKYGMSITGPAVRLNGDKIKEAIEEIKKAAEEISSCLGCCQ